MVAAVEEERDGALVQALTHDVAIAITERDVEHRR
jgi:hypothetical protein